MSRRKVKPDGLSLRQRLNANFMRALEADFEAYGAEVIEQLRRNHTKTYSEIVAKLISPLPEAPKENDLCNAQSSRDLGKLLLLNVGLPDPTDEQIDAATIANDVFIARLEKIRDEAGWASDKDDNGPDVLSQGESCSYPADRRRGARPGG